MASVPKKTTLSLRLRVAFSIILLLVIIVGTFSVLTVRSIHNLLEEVMWENYSSYAQSFAAYAAKSFAERDFPELQRHLDVAQAQPDMIFVLAKEFDGEVIAKSGNVAEQQDFEIIEHIFEDVDVRVDEIGHEPGGLFHSSGHTFLITSKVNFRQEQVGLIQLAVTTASANQRLAQISIWGLSFASGVVILGTIILVFVDRKLKRNITRLIQITRRMATGDLSQRVEIRTGDEIEHLGASFNLMADAIKKHEDQLEDLVHQRTKELESETDKLQLILNNVPSAFIMLDKNLRAESVSAQFENVVGRKRDEILGKSCALSTLLYRSERDCPSRKAFSTGTIQMSEANLTFPDGEEKALEHVAIPITRNGKVENVLEIITDVTDRKRFEQQLVRTEKLSATGEMAAIIAHEMRNSLSSVNLILQCLRDSVGQDEEDTRSLEVATESVNRMEGIVRQLLEFSKPGKIKFQQASVNRLVEESLVFCKYQLQRKHIRLEKKLAPELPLTKLDVERMREVLINLLLNAADAVEEKGKIMVETRLLTLENTLKDEFDQKAISMKKGRAVITIRVVDDASGIETEELHRIFDPFYTTKTKGTGLGLTMAKRAIAEHRGILKAESMVGEGSSFTIYLPLYS